MRKMLAVFMSIVGSLAGAASAAQAPCTDANPSCTEMLPLPGARGGIVVYRSHPLAQPDPAVEHALIVIHGLGRDADAYYASALAGAFAAHALADTIVIAPHFKSAERGCGDTLAPGEVGWHCRPRNVSWRNGGDCVDGGVTTFDAVDELLKRLDDKALFPNLRSIVVVGHSAGGQFVGRYAMSNKAHDALAVKPTYVVMNPSSYTYLDEMRPTQAVFDAHPEALAPGFHPPAPERAPQPFARFHDAESCVSYDRWPYGLQDRSGYAAKVPDEQLRKQAVERPTVYLAGEYDILPLHDFDDTCGAMAQGATRLARAYAYVRYIDERFGAKHEIHRIAGCGHSGRCMLVAGESARFLFPR